MSFSLYLNRLRNSLRTRGAIPTLRLAARRIHDRFAPPDWPVHHFDLQHGVDTSGLFYGSQLRSGHANDPHITAYYATPPSLFRGAIARWQRTLAGTRYQLSDFALIDVGCGKGRVLMLASDLPFRAILGVELNPGLADIARANLAKWNASPHICSNVTVFAADALTLPLASSSTLLYIYNPFGRELLERLLARLSTISHSRSAPIDIIYTHPAHADLFQHIPRMDLLWAGDIPVAPQDTAVDAFNSTGEAAQIYRLAHPASVVAA